MKRVALIASLCVLAFCNYSWGRQTACTDRPQGLVEVLTDIVLAPCGLLSTCLGLDTPMCQRPQPCRVTYPPPRKCPDRILRGDSSTRIKQTREQTGPPTSEKTLPPVKRQKPPTDRPTVQVSPTPPKIQPDQQPPAVSGPAKPLPPALPSIEAPVATPGAPLPSRDQSQPPAPERSPRISEPKVTPAMPSSVKGEAPRPLLPDAGSIKPVPERTTPTIPLEAPKADEVKKPAKSSPKTPCGPVYHPCYPGSYYR
jgi:hypothetical protein